MNWLLAKLLEGLDRNEITEAALWVVIGAFVALAICRRRGTAPALTAYAPTLLASLGMLGTFVGIVVGLLNFDASKLDNASISGLLKGLETAFISSIAGIFFGVLFRVLEPLLIRRDDAAAAGDSPEEAIVALLTEQKVLNQGIRDAIAGSEESSLAGQLKLLRADLSDRRREEDTTRERFERELWQRLETFADALSRSATEQVVEALRAVIVDFNRNLTEQFGDNFRRLDASVQKLVEWQEGYRQQLEQLHTLYDQSVRQVTAVETSVARIAEHSASIPASMERLDPLLKAIHHQIEELERHLQAFAELRDRAVEAVPQTRAHVEAMVEEIAGSVRTASEHAASLQSDSAEQLARSQQMLERLTQAGEQMQADIRTVQDQTAEAIVQMQSRLEAALQQALNAQSQATEDMVQKTLEQTQQAVSRTGEGINKQLEALDVALEQELNRVMQQMANALTQIAGKFTEDYKDLVVAMRQALEPARPASEAMRRTVEAMRQDLEAVRPNLEAIRQDLGTKPGR